MSTRDDSQKFYPTRNVGAVPAKRTDWQTRAEAAESRVADLEAGIDAAADALTRWNKPDDELGQSLVVASVTRHLRALVGVETPGTGEHA